MRKEIGTCVECKQYGGYDGCLKIRDGTTDWWEEDFMGTEPYHVMDDFGCVFWEETEKEDA